MTYFGLYRGVCTNNDDPVGQRRIKALVPSLFGNATTETTWANPCSEPGSTAVPGIGVPVWIAFENGDPDYPVWVGSTA